MVKCGDQPGRREPLLAWTNNQAWLHQYQTANVDGTTDQQGRQAACDDSHARHDKQPLLSQWSKPDRRKMDIIIGSWTDEHMDQTNNDNSHYDGGMALLLNRQPRRRSQAKQQTFWATTWKGMTTILHILKWQPILMARQQKTTTVRIVLLKPATCYYYCQRGWRASLNNGGSWTDRREWTAIPSRQQQPTSGQGWTWTQQRQLWADNQTGKRQGHGRTTARKILMPVPWFS